MRLIELTAENFKRLRAIRITPTDPVTPIVGRNGAGKTSVLDAISAALGGAAEAPDLPIRIGAENAQVVLNLGDIQVRRRWTAKGSSLEVATAEGAKYPSPQAVLDKLVGELSFDPLAFTRLAPGDQAKTLARIAGLDLEAYAARERAAYDERTAVNRDLKAERVKLAAAPEVDAPDEEVRLADVLAEIDRAQATNREANRLVAEEGKLNRLANEARAKVGRLEIELEQARKSMETALAAQAAAAQAAMDAPTIDVDPLRAKLNETEAINRRVRDKASRAQLVTKVAHLDKRAQELTAQLEAIETERAYTIAAANLPVSGLSIAAAGVLFNGVPFADCSGAEKLRVSVAIGLALNPKLRLMLIRDGSLLDSDGMALLAELAETADAQVLIERVSNGAEVGVLIEDGSVVEQPETAEVAS